MGLGGVSLIRRELRHDLVLIPSNVDLDTWPRATEVIEAGGVALLNLHIAKTNYGMSYVSKSSLETVSRLFERLATKFPNEVWFAHLSEVAAFFRASRSVLIEASDRGEGRIEVTIRNPTNASIRIFVPSIKYRALIWFEAELETS